MIHTSSVSANFVHVVDTYEIRESAWSAAEVAYKTLQSAEAALDVARTNYSAAKSIADAACNGDLPTIDVAPKIDTSANDAAVAAYNSSTSVASVAYFEAVDAAAKLEPADFQPAFNAAQSIYCKAMNEAGDEYSEALDNIEAAKD